MSTVARFRDGFRRDRCPGDTGAVPQSQSFQPRRRFRNGTTEAPDRSLSGRTGRGVIGFRLRKTGNNPDHDSRICGWTARSGFREPICDGIAAHAASRRAGSDVCRVDSGIEIVSRFVSSVESLAERLRRRYQASSARPNRISR